MVRFSLFNYLILRDIRNLNYIEIISLDFFTIYVYDALFLCALYN